MDTDFKNRGSLITEYNVYDVNVINLENVIFRITRNQEVRVKGREGHF